MKRLCIFLALLMGLSGCGAARTMIASEEVPEREEAQAEIQEEWGLTPEEAAPSPSPTYAPTPTPVPTPTPTPEPRSLREIYADTVTVWVDGIPLDGLLQDGAELVNASQLSQVWDWFQWEGTEKAWTFTGELDGMDHQLSCCSPERFSGVECVYYAGDEEEYWLPARWLSGWTVRLMLRDPEEQAVYLTEWPQIQDIPVGEPVPVLMYHAVSDDLWGIEDLFVSPEQMRAQLEYLLDRGYEPIFFSDLTHLEDYEKPILLTFDDGYDDNYVNLFPLLQEYQMKATVFVITGLLDGEHYMTRPQVRELSESGLVDIQSHTVEHQDLETLSYEEQEYQMAQSRLDIARITGRIPYVLAYPSGSRNEDTLALAPDYYSFGIDMGGGLWYTGESWYKVDRIYVSRSDTLEDFAAKIP